MKYKYLASKFWFDNYKVLFIYRIIFIYLLIYLTIKLNLKNYLTATIAFANERILQKQILSSI